MDAQSLTWLYLPAAFGLGMAHALEPGHGKTLVAAYLVSIKGTNKDAVLLGLTVTFTHTIIVFLLAAGVLALEKAFPLDRVQHWLEVTSALLVLVMGLWMLRARLDEWKRHRGHVHDDQHRHHHHDSHHHDHDAAHLDHGHGHHDHGHGHHDNGHGNHGHSHPLPVGERLSLRQLLSFGMSGGLVPCPAALAILILAVGAGKPILGLMTVLVFSIGLGLTLVGIGVAVCQGTALFEGSARSNAWIQRLPLLSSLIVAVLGLVMLIYALFGHGHAQQASSGRQAG